MKTKTLNVASHCGFVKPFVWAFLPALGLLFGVAQPSHADSSKGNHLLYVKMGNARPASIGVWNSRDGGFKCYKASAQDIKTNFTVNNKWWFQIRYYSNSTCSGGFYKDLWWYPTSDSQKYWYAVLT